jgi:hypothetical protein
VTFKFEFVEGKKKSNYSGCFSKLMCNGEPLCNMEEWLFQSCAVHGMSGMTDHYHPSVPWTTKLVDALLEWFKEVKGAQGGWPWREVLFCITAHQRDQLQGLVKHPNVKLIDRFTNKAHGGAIMYLYRLSVEKDFKRVNKN